MSYLNFYKSSLKPSKYRQQLHVYRGMFDSRLSKPVAFCSEQNKKQPVLHNRGKLKSREHEVKAFRCRIIPDILVVGMEKCGTTTLRSFLGIHPQIFVPLPLDVNVFLTARFENFTLSDYFEFKKERNQTLKCTPDGMLRMEKAGIGVKHAERVYQYSRNMKLIANCERTNRESYVSFLRLYRA